MPCFDSRVDDDTREARKRLDKATRVACELSKLLRPGAILSREAAVWITEHEKMDRARLAEERRQRQEKLLAQKALAKLTKAEREILGL